MLTAPIISQPQVAILSTDAIVRQARRCAAARRQLRRRRPSRREPGDELGPPGVRRRLRRRVPEAHQGAARDQGLGRRVVSRPHSRRGLRRASAPAPPPRQLQHVTG
ncbi:MAG: hypothetical protein WKF58_10785 [Ilumatobacteraceae bacterium]